VKHRGFHLLLEKGLLRTELSGVCNKGAEFRGEQTHNVEVLVRESVLLLTVCYLDDAHNLCLRTDHGHENKVLKYPLPLGLPLRVLCGTFIDQSVHLSTVGFVILRVALDYALPRLKKCHSDQRAGTEQLNLSDSLRVLLKQKLIDPSITVIL
jgi:hypothetical protein